MSTAHIVDLPKPIWAVKCAQLALSVLVLALQAYCVALIGFSTSGFAIFTALWSIISLIYYFVSVNARSCHSVYNWIAHLVLECLAVVFWLATWGSLAALYAILDYAYDIYDGDLNSTGQAYAGCFLASLALAVINWILFCVSLGFFGKAIHQHRKAGRPITADGRGGEKIELGRGQQQFNQQSYGQQQYAPQPEYVNETGGANRYP